MSPVQQLLLRREHDEAMFMTVVPFVADGAKCGPQVRMSAKNQGLPLCLEEICLQGIESGSPVVAGRS
jgi:hypothetical protein